jgi:deoxycytidylate deaminase
MIQGDRYIEISKALQPHQQCRRTFHTTFIVRKGKIQRIGVNSLKTHPRNLQYNYKNSDGMDIRSMVGIHSELDAVIKWGRKDCTDCVFINVRINNNGQVAMAAPCCGCQSILRQVGFKQVYYTNNQGVFEEWC